jgi:hypothetical protein
VHHAADSRCDDLCCGGAELCPQSKSRFPLIHTINNLIHALGTRDAGHDEVQVGKATPYFLILGADISCREDERAQMHPGEVARKEDQRMKQEEFDRAQGFVSQI